MPLQPIPEAWRTAVCAILKTEDRQFIKSTDDAQERFDADFEPDWFIQVYASLRAALLPNNVIGCPVDMKGEPGETWEFLFEHQRRIGYGKIKLSKNRKKIVIFSAHLKRKKKLRCE